MLYLRDSLPIASAITDVPLFQQQLQDEGPVILVPQYRGSSTCLPSPGHSLNKRREISRYKSTVISASQQGKFCCGLHVRVEPCPRFKTRGCPDARRKSTVDVFLNAESSDVVKVRFIFVPASGIEIYVFGYARDCFWPKLLPISS